MKCYGKFNLADLALKHKVPSKDDVRNWVSQRVKKISKDFNEEYEDEELLTAIGMNEEEEDIDFEQEDFVIETHSKNHNCENNIVQKPEDECLEKLELQNKLIDQVCMQEGCKRNIEENDEALDELSITNPEEKQNEDSVNLKETLEFGPLNESGLNDT